MWPRKSWALASTPSGTGAGSGGGSVKPKTEMWKWTQGLFAPRISFQPTVTAAVGSETGTAKTAPDAETMDTTRDLSTTKATITTTTSTTTDHPTHIDPAQPPRVGPPGAPLHTGRLTCTVAASVSALPRTETKFGIRKIPDPLPAHRRLLPLGHRRPALAQSSSKGDRFKLCNKKKA